MFVSNLINEINNDGPEHPSRLFGDNMGVILLANNLAVGQQTKHIDIRTRFMTDLVDNEQIAVHHERSEDNPADIRSKHCKEAIRLKHAANIYKGKLEPISEDI